ncbi:hypothetical protein V2G26_014181 [Clonostachys chloroleuca]
MANVDAYKREYNSPTWPSRYYRQAARNKKPESPIRVGGAYDRPLVTPLHNIQRYKDFGMRLGSHGRNTASMFTSSNCLVCMVRRPYISLSSSTNVQWNRPIM